MQLEPIPPITQLSKHVIRILGQNPGKFTLQGTNTYLLGSRSPYVLLDTGEEETSAAYIPFLRQALTDSSLAPLYDTKQPLISDIIISHWHHDHLGGLPAVLSLLKQLSHSGSFIPPKIHKHPLNQPLPPDKDTFLQKAIAKLDSNIFQPNPSGGVFHDLSDGQIISLSSDEGASLRIMATPGHTSDSIAIALPFDKALYTADTVLGQGTAVFEDLAQYIASLRRMLTPEWSSHYSVLYPGHGPAVKEGKETIQTYIDHRMERETQIVTALKQKPTDDAPYWSTWSLVKSIYASYPESLWLPAAHSVDLHLRKLEGESTVKRVSGEGKDTIWEVIEPST